MPRKQRIHYTDELKSEIWNKYRQGFAEPGNAEPMAFPRRT